MEHELLEDVYTVYILLNTAIFPFPHSVLSLYHPVVWQKLKIHHAHLKYIGNKRNLFGMEYMHADNNIIFLGDCISF